MSIRVGIDLVSVEQVRESIRDHGDRYLRRIYTEAELHDCRGDEGPVPERLAARFAAKEAALKVLRPAEEAIPWCDIEVVRHPTGWVELKLGGRAAASAAGQGLGDFTLSMSHEAGFATAVVAAGRA
jgi:holo-[acyl-carrier protein] synthase